LIGAAGDRVQRAASSLIFVTVFQLRVVLTTPSRRSRNVPVYLVLAYPSGVCT
jgi:hypothetical protein